MFLVIWSLWLLSEILLNRMMGSKQKQLGSKNHDQNSLRFIWITIFISITAGIMCNIYFYFPLIESSWVNYTGLFLIIAGMIFRFIAIYTLGSFFTVDVAFKDSQKLINKGLYKYIRHPSYTGSLLSFFGFGISLNNWLSVIVIFIPVLVVFMYRIKIEEKLLSEKLGSSYTEYINHTKRLIPFVY
ncbi:methyltransferase family protein [Saccharicrinis sp. FJH62]